MFFFLNARIIPPIVEQEGGGEIGSASHKRIQDATRLVLQQCNLSDEVMQSFRDTLQESRHIESMLLERCTFTPRGLYYFMLGPLESDESALSNLNIEDSDVGDVHAK